MSTKTLEATANFRKAIGRGLFTSEATLNAFAGIETDDKGEGGDDAPKDETDDKADAKENADEDDDKDETETAAAETEGTDRASFSLAEMAEFAQRKLEANKSKGPDAGDDVEKDEDDDDADKAAAADKEGEKEKEKEPEKTEPVAEDKKDVVKVTKRRVKSDPLPEPPELKGEPETKPILKTDDPAPDLAALTEGLHLSEDERDYLEIVQYAERADGKAHAGLVKREVARIKSLHAHVEKWEADHPGEPFRPDYDDETRRAYEQLKSKAGGPALTRSDVRKLERQMVREEVEERAEEKLRAAVAPMERKLQALKDEPEINTTVDGVAAKLEDTLPEDVEGLNVKALIKEGGGLEAFVKADPVLGAAAGAALQRGKASIREYMKIARGLITPDLGKVSDDGQTIEGGNSTHRYIADIIPKVGDYWEKNGGDGRFVDGKQFLPVAKYYEVARKNPAAAAKKYWTFNEAQIVEILAGQTQAAIVKEVKDAQDRLQKSGWTRVKPKAAGDKAKVEPQPDGGDKDERKPSPRVGVKPAGGGGGKAKTSSALDVLMTASRARR